MKKQTITLENADITALFWVFNTTQPSGDETAVLMRIAIRKEAKWLLDKCYSNNAKFAISFKNNPEKVAVWRYVLRHTLSSHAYEQALITRILAHVDAIWVNTTSPLFTNINAPF